MAVVDVVIPSWRPVAGHPEYEVSDQGQVRSIARVHLVPCRWGGVMERVLASRVLKTWLANSGYPMVAMGAKREGRAYIHRLVAEAFLDRPDGCDQVNHKSGDKSDNSAANLEWVTQSQNMVHAVHALGVRGGQFGPGRKRYAAGVRAA